MSVVHIDAVGMAEGHSGEPAGYRDFSLLRSSGSATTYRARREADGDVVAVKILSPDLSAGTVRDRLRDELSLARQLTGTPHTLDVVDWGDTPTGQIYVTTPFCHGGSLADWLTTGALLFEDVIDASMAIASALHAVHGLGRCHRGVKPTNILFTAAEPVLGEFVTVGLRWACGMPDGSEDLPYLAPEVLTGEPHSARSDIYALAATAFHVITGAVPYPGARNAAEQLRLIHDGPQPTIQRRGVPDSLKAILHRGLAAEPAQRPADASVFGQELYAVLSELGLCGRYTYAPVMDEATIGVLRPVGQPSQRSASGSVRPSIP
jgi:serine/threonine-protein kinase PknK